MKHVISQTSFSFKRQTDFSEILEGGFLGKIVDLFHISLNCDLCRRCPTFIAPQQI